MCKVTVFTPTYNRAYTLRRLYESLCCQDFRDFEWLVIDDGSTDDTEPLMRNILEERKILVRYVKQLNGGKHRAINRGVRVASGELFFIVDSDDYLIPTAITHVWSHYEDVKHDPAFCGVSGLKCYPNGAKVGGEENWTLIDATPYEIRLRYHVKGDLAEVWRTSILARFPFPEFEGETFCSEGLVWRRIARAGYKLRFFYEKLYICEYLEDGLTKNLRRTLKRGLQASVLQAYEYYNDVSWRNFVLKIRVGGTWWERVFLARRLRRNVFIGSLGAVLSFPVGLLMLIYHKF